jgi:hypothetical protein
MLWIGIGYNADTNLAVYVNDQKLEGKFYI